MQNTISKLVELVQLKVNDSVLENAGIFFFSILL